MSVSGIVNIKDCEKLYPDEWLLFEVAECDEKNQPVKGKLLAHSKDRDEIHQIDMQHKKALTYAFFNGEEVPKDMAVALCAQ